MKRGLVQAVPQATADRRAPVIVLIVVGIIVALAVMREILAPAAPFGDNIELLDQGDSQRNFIRPLGLLVDIVLSILALSSLARALDRRGWRPVASVVATSLLSIALSTVF